MDFSWTQAQRERFEATLRFAEKRSNRALERRLRERSFCHETWREFGDFGLLGACAPESLGGLGLGMVDCARTYEALGRGCQDTGLVFSAAAHLFACVVPIVEFGDAEQKARFVPPLCSGAQVAANALSEADAGSDSGQLKMRATREGDFYVLDGVKSYVTNAPIADLFICYATVDPKWGHMGITAFLVESKRPGIIVAKPFTKPGLVTSPMASVQFNACKVPASNRLGAEGQGATIFATSMHWERSCLFAGYLGATHRHLHAIIEHAKTRRQFRRPIGKFQAISHRIVDLYQDFRSAQLLLYQACWARDRGETATAEVAMAKLAISELAVQTGLAAVQIFGGQGYTMDTGVPHLLLDALPSTILSGTSEMQRELIAASLGL